MREGQEQGDGYLSRLEVGSVHEGVTVLLLALALDLAHALQLEAFLSLQPTFLLYFFAFFHLQESATDLRVLLLPPVNDPVSNLHNPQ